MKLSVTQIFNILVLLRAAYAEDPDLLAWRGYGTYINGFLTAGQTVRPGIDYVFVTPPGTVTVQGGSPIPDAFTNQGIFELADTMQLPDAPIFGTVGTSYAGALQSYLNAVASIGTDPTPEQLAKLDALKETQAKASADLTKERLAAIAAFVSWPLPKPAGQSLDVWAIDNYPSYLQAKTAMKTAQARVNQYNREINDPDMIKLDNQITGLETKALDPSTYSAGYNMPTFSGNNPFSIAPFQKNEITDATQLVYRPAYTMTGYEEACDAWIKGSVAQQTTATLNFKSVTSSNWTDLGHSTSVKRGGAGFLSFISANLGGSTQTTDFTSYSGTFSTDVTVTLKMKAAPVVIGVKPGSWDVPNARTTWPKLRAGKPDTLGGQIRIEKVLIGYGVSLNIVWNDLKSWTQVRTFTETAQKSGGGGLSIFGFKFGASTSKTYTRNFNNITTFNSPTGGGFDLAPTPDGLPILLGAYGRKF